MPRPFSLDDLIALNDEIRALARAGVPLDRGLIALARDLPGRLRRNAEALANSLQEGRSLEDALDDVARVPPAYRAVVQAGMRSGQLAAALQGIAATSRRATQVAKTTTVAMLYPLLVFAVATVVVTFAVNNTAPVIDDIYREFEVSRPAWYSWNLAVARAVTPWIPGLWAAICLTMVAGWLSSRRSSSLHGVGRGWFPGAASMIREGRLATFSDILALLIEQRIPLNESIRLAASSAGDYRLMAAAESLSQRIERGEGSPELPAGLPPLLGWLLVSGCSPEVFVKSLRRSAANHQLRAAEFGRWVGVYLPVLLSAGLGGAIALLYALLVLGPFYHLLRAL